MNYTGVLTGDLMHLRNSVYHLRYEVLVAEQKKQPRYADHCSGMVKEPLDATGEHIVKVVAGKLAGAARINRFRDMQDPFFLNCYGAASFYEYLLPDEVVIVSRMILLPDFRGSASFAAFACEIYRWVLESNSSVILIECTPTYERVFRKLGFFPYCKPFTHPDGMIVSPMLLDCNNREWLKQIGSIFDRVYPPHFREKPGVSAAIEAIRQTLFIPPASAQGTPV